MIQTSEVKENKQELIVRLFQALGFINLISLKGLGLSAILVPGIALINFAAFLGFISYTFVRKDPFETLGRSLVNWCLFILGTATCFLWIFWWSFTLLMGLFFSFFFGFSD